MIRAILSICLIFFISDGICGITILGTRFIINDEMKHLNIKVTNDHESDYLIKNTLDDKDFIISPPLFLLPKNSSSIITVILKEKKQYDRDKIVNLTMTAIPRSAMSDDSDSVSLAVRNHFKIIYRHAHLQPHHFKKVKIRHQDNKCILDNDSDFSFTVSISKNKSDMNAEVFNLLPHQKKQTRIESVNSECVLWMNFYDEYNDVIDTIKLTT